MTTLAQPAQTRASTLQAHIITDFAQAMTMRQKLVKAAPRNASYQFLLARDAYAARSYGVVATALQAYLKLSPNLTAAQKTQLRRQIAEFKVLAKSSSSSGTPSTSGGG
jgi:cytochrome c-type biogenesis protein CcmH/NrfG